MNNLRPTSTSWHSTKPTFVHKSLETCTHVFVRNDSIRPSLSHPYQGPYEVIKRTPKYFMINSKGRQTNISIDRLKPAFSDNSDDEKQHTTQSAATTTTQPVTTITHSATKTTQPATTTSKPFTTTAQPTSTATTTTKAATQPTSAATTTTTSTKVTRSGRRVIIPKRYQ